VQQEIDPITVTPEAEKQAEVVQTEVIVSPKVEEKVDAQALNSPVVVDDNAKPAEVVDPNVVVIPVTTDTSIPVLTEETKPIVVTTDTTVPVVPEEIKPIVVTTDTTVPVLPEETNPIVVINTETSVKTELPIVQEAVDTNQVEQDSVAPLPLEEEVDTSDDIPDTFESVLPPDDENEVVSVADQTSPA
jgi:hypothetical protein